MTRNKLAIIGGSGLYDVEEFTERELINVHISISAMKKVHGLLTISFLEIKK